MVVVLPEPDHEIFNRLLAAGGIPSPGQVPKEIFERIASQIPRYQGMDYDNLGESGAQPDK